MTSRPFRRHLPPRQPATHDERCQTPCLTPASRSSPACERSSDAGRYVLLDRRDGAFDVRVRVVEVRGEANAGPVLAAARRAADVVFLIERGGQLANIEVAGLERDHRHSE